MLTCGKCALRNISFAVVSRCGGHTNHAFPGTTDAGYNRRSALHAVCRWKAALLLMARRTQAVFRSVPAGQKLLKFGHIFCRSQQEEDGVKIAFSRHYAIFAQEVSKNRRGYTERFIFAVTCINTWGCQQQFARIDKVLILCIAFKRMPVLPLYNWKNADQPQFALFIDCQGLPSTSSGTTDEYADSYRGSVCGH